MSWAEFEWVYLGYPPEFAESGAPSEPRPAMPCPTPPGMVRRRLRVRQQEAAGTRSRIFRLNYYVLSAEGYPTVAQAIRDAELIWYGGWGNQRIQRYKVVYKHWLDKQREHYLSTQHYVLGGAALHDIWAELFDSPVGSAPRIDLSNVYPPDRPVYPSPSSEGTTARREGEPGPSLRNTPADKWTGYERQQYSEAFRDRLREDWRDYRRGDTDRRPPYS